MNYIERLASRYNLSIISEDLGLCNASSSRLSEFIKIFMNHDAEESEEWDELVDLIFESANQAILDGSFTQEHEQAIVEIVKNHRDKCESQRQYWLAFCKDKDMPLMKLITLGED